ncbi:MAG: SDR family NAD(P)-dependent oxidoreductase [Acidimicrobiales bacterium]|jgi:NAD(P)-dependent dehydrogenase (short-subunit alcohol dehydrogenase family)
MKISGSGAIVSGGASGLGEATVRALASRGAIVTIFDRDEPKARALAEELGAGTSYAAGDVGDPEAVTRAVEQAAASAVLRIDVNCAGIAWVQRTIGRQGEPHDFEAFKTVVSVNLIGTFNVMRLAAAAISRTEPLAHGERGVIVNTASVAAFEGQIGQIAYSASKGGIAGMTMPAARDLSVVGIRVNTIAPGIMNTPLLGLLPQENLQALGQGVLFPKRLGGPDEFAELVIAIIENGYLNGETIRLDGGLRMPPK